MLKNKKIYVSGHTGLLGSSIIRQLNKKGFNNIIFEERKNLNLLDTENVNNFFKINKPDYVILSAGVTGGIEKNKNEPFDLMYQNLRIQLNLFKSCHDYKVQKTIFFGSSCMYPSEVDRPMKEDLILTGKMEKSSISYAIAKLAGLEMSSALNRQFNMNSFFPIIPNSMYGPKDNFNPNTGHVLASLIYKFYDAKINNSPHVVLWGDGSALREFIYVDDVADACIFLLKSNVNDVAFPLNVGTGYEISIYDLALTISNVIGYDGEIYWDKTKPNGTKRKLLDSSQMNLLGWKPKTKLKYGIQKTINWYIHNTKKTMPKNYNL